MASSNTKVSLRLKILIDTKGQRILFAEAGKDFVDFLFTLLSLPIGSVVGLLLSNSTGMAGSLGKLYKSIEVLSDAYLQPTLNKNDILNPKPSFHDVVVTPFLLPSHELAAEKIYGCHNNWRGGSCTNYVSDDPRAICPQCGGKISRERIIVSHSELEEEFSSADEGGYVKGVVTYMVMDDLEVKPMSTISSLTMLRTFNVKDIADLEEKMISIGMDEGFKLLKASFQSKTVLTDVFLGMKAT